MSRSSAAETRTRSSPSAILATPGAGGADGGRAGTNRPRPRARAHGAAHMAALGLGEVRDAERRLRGRIHRTPLLTCAGLDRMAGRRLLFKCELLQRTGSFKVRGDGGTANPRGKGRFLQSGKLAFRRYPPAPGSLPRTERMV